MPQGRPVAHRQQTGARIVVAAALAAVFACALGIMAVAVAVHAVTIRGTIGTAASDFKGGRTSPATGVWALVAALLAAAAFLIRGAVRALRQERFSGIVIPLGLLVLFGSVGEIMDLLGTASGASDLIGAGIIILAALPVALLWRPLRESYRKNL